ncbi:hypothetical protein GCM10007940_33660 [Portibacter lacus]|uniref:Endonuclease/exonuclease/phosphatase domain-containing protein n=2 Tax=Portibacter lacus TaxID=1099794 RepID=A0AA37WHF8_9BACT|nr:hypothetical protein GCM10007940_33660 [Portibacter lacus]
MAWNILHGARDIENGPQHAIEIIKELNPDVILMVETYGSGKIIADACGYNFHLIAKEGTALDDRSVNLSIYSKFPFGDRIDTDYPFYLGGREIFINDQKVHFFSNWFHYLPWENEPEKMGKSVAELLEWEKTETRVNMVNNVLPVIEKYAVQTDSIPLIYAGDMNSPSHLDWGENTKEIHNGLIVPWYATKIFQDLDMIDSYREINPDPITSPGITWDSKGKRDEHRIDYIYYKSPKLKAVHSKSYKAFLGEPLSINGKKINYPSDHGIVITDFILTQ